jgi:hypothetical protein
VIRLNLKDRKQRAMRNVHHQNNNHKRTRGRHQHHNNRKNQNPLTRTYESNGPDVKIRGTASTIAEKYIQLARDAQSSGDPVAAENYYQHAEHYFRLIATAQEQLRQQNPGQYSQPQPSNSQSGVADDTADDEEEDFQSAASGQTEPYGRDQPQPYLPRDAQPFPPREQPAGRSYQQGRGNAASAQNQPQPADNDRDIGGLPSFITGSQPSPSSDQPAQPAAAAAAAEERNGDRFPLHRRRRRHRGNRPEFNQAAQPEAAEEQPGE